MFFGKFKVERRKTPHSQGYRLYPLASSRHSSQIQNPVEPINPEPVKHREGGKTHHPVILYVDYRPQYFQTILL